MNADASASSLNAHRPIRHRVLSAYYPHVRSLASLLPANIVRPKDPIKFSQFLSECLVATTSTIPLDSFSLLPVDDHSIGMSEVLNQVLQRIFQHHSVLYHQQRRLGLPAFTVPKHLLAAGHKLVTFTGMNHTGVGTGPLYESVFTNTVASSMSSSKHWHTVLSRTGPDSIIKLLASNEIALFEPLEHDCLLQISGLPLVELEPLSSVPNSSSASQAKTGRKTHCRAGPKKRGKKKGHSLEFEPVPCPIGADTDAMELDEPSPASPSKASTEAACPPQALPLTVPAPPAVSVQKNREPALNRDNPLVYFCSSDMATGPPDLALLGDSSLNAFSTNSIVFSRFRLYHARMSKTKQNQTVYDVLSRLDQYFVLPKTVVQTRTSKPRDKQSKKKRKTSLAQTETKQADSTYRDAAAARHLAKYMFPYEFGLYNVFSSAGTAGGVGSANGMRVRPDTEDRELEIKKLGTIKTPKRIKGKQLFENLDKLIVLYQRCNFRKLLTVKCPSKVSHKKLDEQAKKNLIFDMMTSSNEDDDEMVPATQTSRMASMPGSLPTTMTTQSTDSGTVGNTIDRSFSNTSGIPQGEEGSSITAIPQKVHVKPKLAEFACTPYEVESYVMAVVRDVIPRSFWGSESNAQLIFKQISQFLRMRRFETISLHTLLQGFSVLDCDWLVPHRSARAKEEKVTRLELERRKQVLGQFLYWLFDSFITDLVRTAFYVTDSATHQNRPLYFRQDDWAALSAPLLESLGETVFERIPDNQLIALERQPRDLGFSYVRLLPKATGVRPIVNLARKPLQIGQNGELEVGQPINKILRSVFDVLTFESKRNPHLVGSLVSNPQEIYAKLKGFKAKLLEEHGTLPELYFVKVDVKSCFDTIKQEKLLALLEGILSETLYYIQKYTQVVAYSGKTARQFKRQACGDDDLGSFRDLALQLAKDLHNVVLADQVRYDDIGIEKLLSLLKEHITINLVKVNNRLYRQKDGIPQGSVLSSLLCSLFYGDMESTHLAFTKDDHSVMLRYVDDFLFVSTKKHLAVRFLSKMHQGIPDYGCFISNEKRLTNFDVALEPGELVPPLPDGQDFGYCGLAIDTKTLEIQMNLQLQMSREIVNQLTVQRFRKPGEAFLSAMLRAVKIRAHPMYTDTNYNSSATVYLNIYQAMLVVALKFSAYVQEWTGTIKGRVAFFWKAVQKIVKYEYAALLRHGQSRRAAKLSATLELERSHVIWLGYHAFHRVLSRQKASYSPLLRLLLLEVKSSKARKILPVLEEIVNNSKNGFVSESNAVSSL
ncbi:telomerase reverse transcriptase [Sporobolomyces koalae]|uniref:telomerase reverse transcriptase n=1 Tax=Sporobolomyces koalae TaxID=500713 RepID=UPI00317AE017